MSEDYSVKLKIQNGPMLNDMSLAGVKNASQLSKVSKVSVVQVCDYLNLKAIPLNKKVGGWRKSICKIADVLNTRPIDLFPEQHIHRCLENNKAEVEISFLELEFLLGGGTVKSPEEYMLEMEDVIELGDILDTIPPREKRALVLKYGLDGQEPMTHKEVGALIGPVCTQRARQIVNRALGKLRHPKRAQELKKLFNT